MLTNFSINARLAFLLIMLMQGKVLGQQVFVDPTFNAQASLNSTVWASQIQSDGKIIVGGEFTNFNSTIVNRIVRLNTDGTIDNSFVIGTGFNSTVWAIAIQSDGKILVGGQFTNYNGASCDKLVRLNSNGTIDASFTPPLLPGSSVRAIVPENNGDVLVGGVINQKMIRLKSTGALDPTFIFNTSIFQVVIDIKKQPDGKILASGGGSGSLVTICRLLSNGANDPSFVCDPSVNNISIRTIALQTDGKVVVGGDFTGGFVARLNSNGSRDLTFNVGSGTNANVWTSNIFPNGAVLIGGAFTSFNGSSPQRNLVVLNTNGGISTDYNFGNGFSNTPANSAILSSQIQSDGKILAFGAFSSFNGTNRTNIVRLTTQCVPPTISVNPVSQSVCAGQSVTFSVTAQGTALQFQWKNSSGNVGLNSSTFTTSTPGNYSVVVSNSCGSVTSSVASLTNLPTAAPTQPSCALTSIGICTTSTGVRKTLLTWQAGGGNKQLVVASTNPITSFPVSGTTYLANSDFGLGTNLGNNNYVVFNGPTSQLSVVVTGLPTYPSHLYFEVFNYNDQCGTPQYLTKSFASAYIPATDPITSCPSLRSEPETNIKVSDESYSSSFQVFPNPSNGSFTIEIGQQEVEHEVQFKVSNLSGKIIDKGTFKGSKHQINLSGNSTGLYILELTQGSSVHVQKIVIE